MHCATCSQACLSSLVFWACGFYVAFQFSGSSSCKNQNLTSTSCLLLYGCYIPIAASKVCCPRVTGSTSVPRCKANLPPNPDCGLKPEKSPRGRDRLVTGWLLPAADPLPPPPCSLRDCHRNRQRRRNQRECLAHPGRQEEQIQGIPCGKFFQTAGLSEVRGRVFNGMGVGRASQRPSLKGLQMGQSGTYCVPGLQFP